MSAPGFEWKTYALPAQAGSALRTLETGAGTDEPLTIELPDLTAWPAPLDKARILLESAAEVEHALLVQYLYAEYSLKHSEDVSDPDQRSAIDDWSFVAHKIAREEMGHLMTVQNLLLALGLAPSFEREDFPPRKDLYPFALHLEPLSQRSLAKYVMAEAPADASGIDDIAALATASAGTTVNRVGVLYGLLALVFSTAEQVPAGPAGEPWAEMLRRLAAAAYQQAPDEAWHLPDGAIDDQTLERQANPSSWQRGSVRVHQIADRASALDAIRDVAEQGEGLTGDQEESHFGRLLGMYRGGDASLPFPAAGAWVPTRAVPTDPRTDDIAEPRTRRWTQLGDLRYALLLGFVEHHLLTSDEDQRSTLAGWTFSEMFQLGPIARTLTTLPSGPGVGAFAFALPAPQHLPATEAERWAIHEARTRAAIATVEELQGADPADAEDGLLTDLLASDRERLEQIAAATSAPGSGSGATTSFARDVLALFRPIDIEHMIDQVGMDLGQYEVVRNSARAISERVKSRGPRRMPPPPDPPWTEDQTALFDRWVAEGFPQ